MPFVLFPATQVNQKDKSELWKEAVKCYFDRRW